MFTGLIREIATVKSYENNILSIQAKHKAKLGDSMLWNLPMRRVLLLMSLRFQVRYILNLR